MTQQSRQDNLHSGITRVGYDANNQPDSVTFSTGESIRYYYDGMGNRLGTDEYTAFMPVYLQGAANTLTDDDSREVLRRRYCGNFIYEDGILQRVLVEGGFITFSNGTPQYHFYIKDHLGSNRVVTDANGNIEEYNHYYPYGALMNISSASTQPYKYNGKELNRLNRLLWYDYSARQYNPILGRFSSVDPLCEKYYGMSPYVYCKCNPINRIDPDGMDDYFDNNGNFIRSTNSGRIIMVLDGEGFVKLSDKCYNSVEGQKALHGIAHHYFSQIDNKAFVLNLGVNDKGAAMAYSPQHDSYSMMMNKDGYVSVDYNIIDNLVNSCFHEYTHRVDDTTRDGALGEVKAILAQVGHPSWLRVTQDFAVSQAKYAANSLTSASETVWGQYVNILNDAFEGIATFEITSNGVECIKTMDVLEVKPNFP